MNAKYPPLLLKYLRLFQDDPKSRIFAPLAESYRKIGLIDEAIQICKEGLEANPNFVGGKVALARAYFDKKKYTDVRETLREIVSVATDNLVAQKLYAEACLLTGYLEEALQSYKVLLYFNPQDTDAAAIVQEMETQSYEGGGVVRLGTHVIRKPEKLRRLMKLQRVLNKVQGAQRI